MLGRHRLLCGDSTVATDVERVLGGFAPHLMVTDPPYGVNYDPAWRNQAGGDGFEPSVPRKISWLPRRSPQLTFRNINRPPSRQGPMVRIHLPPAASPGLKSWREAIGNRLSLSMHSWVAARARAIGCQPLARAAGLLAHCYRPLRRLARPRDRATKERPIDPAILGKSDCPPKPLLTRMRPFTQPERAPGWRCKKVASEKIRRRSLQTWHRETKAKPTCHVASWSTNCQARDLRSRLCRPAQEIRDTLGSR